MAFSIPAQAFFWGIVSAVALPMGAIVALIFKVPKRVNCALMAFGAGALLFAVTIEIYGHALCRFEENQGKEDKVPMIMLGIGSIAGAVMFSVSNYLIEHQGGFLRQLALKHRWFIWRRKRTNVSKSGGVKQYGTEADPLLQRPAGMEHADSLLDDPPSEIASERASIDLEISDSRVFSESKTLHIEETSDHADAHESSVGIAIWLGILIDAFPESIVIGILTSEGISFTFILGVFLSNFPEALSSSVIMKRAGMAYWKILVMWTSVMLITGAGAALGALAFAGEQSRAHILAAKTVEGLAGGAMMVVISETVLPEAFRHAGKLVGFSTLLGFLAAYVVKLSEE